MLDEILRFNQEFVARKDYLPYQTTKYPDRKLAIHGLIIDSNTGVLRPLDVQTKK